MHVQYDVLLARAQRMREFPTVSESLFAARLTKAGIPFETQVIIGSYIVDFLLGNLIIEIDGSVHDKPEQKAYDERRDNYLRSCHFNLIRIKNSRVKAIDLSPFKNQKPRKRSKSLRKQKKRERQQAARAQEKALQARRDEKAKPRLLKPSNGDFDSRPIRGKQFRTKSESANIYPALKKERKPQMKVIIAGSRAITDALLIYKTIRQAKFDIAEVVCGGAEGVDKYGARWAQRNQKRLTVFKAQWGEHGKAAGPIRNRQMAEYADALILIWDGQSRGSMNMLEEATKRGLKIHEHIVKPDMS